jgi:hypothetical protein
MLRLLPRWQKGASGMSGLDRRIQKLRVEAGEAGDASMVEMCDRVLGFHELRLRGVATRTAVTPKELGVTLTRYVKLMYESLDLDDFGCVEHDGEVYYAE